jgi:protease II
VLYWEPAKWIAKLRRLRTDKNLIAFRPNLDAGHAGAVALRPSQGTGARQCLRD